MYSPDKENNAIYKGIASVKFLNSDVAQQMYEMREKKFDTFSDYLKVNPCNSKQTEILIKLGFFSEFGKSQKLLDEYNIFDTYYGKKQLKKNKINLDENLIAKYSTNTEKMYKIIDSDGLVKELCNAVNNKEIPLTDRLSAEKEYLGYIDYKNPKAPEGLYYVTEMKVYKDKCKPYVTLYHLKTGTILKTKVVSANEYANSPFKENSILNVWFDDKYKSQLVNGKWVKTDEKEKVMAHWEIMKN